MDTIDKMLSLKETIKTKIEQALKNGNTKTIVAAAKDLDLLERLEKQYKEIETAIVFLAQKGSFNMSNSQNIKSPKQIGQDERDIFIQEAKKQNIILLKKKGQLYTDKSGRLVGIAYASECAPDRWWLGLPKKKYHSIVLLCRNERLKTTYYIFPYSFCERYQDKFGTDKKAKQIKFNVSSKNGLCTLSIPNSRPITINEYIDKFDNIAH